MSILTGSEIIKQVMDGRIIINPFNLNNIGPNSYDLTLGSSLSTYANKLLDANEENQMTTFDIPDSGFILQPNILYLGHTIEYNGSSHYVPILHGRSSIARLGMFVHSSAGFGDLSWYGQWTLEITVTHPLKIYPNTRVCQVCFESIIGLETRYSGKYQDQSGPTPSKLWMDKLRNNDCDIPILVSNDIKNKIISLCTDGTNKIAYIPWDTKYCVSDMGDIISLVSKEPRLLSKFYRKNEYQYVQIRKIKIYIHRLVASAFLGAPIHGNEILIIRHLDGNPNNNILSNLRYGTHNKELQNGR